MKKACLVEYNVKDYIAIRDAISGADLRGLRNRSAGLAMEVSNG